MRIACAFIFLILSNKGIAMDLSEYKGKVVLVVNIATRCGYTGQLDGLEKLYQRFKDKGLVVLGVPSNDFGSQTPEGNDEVKKFCKLNYGVSFPLTPKMVVSGAQKDPLFIWLTKTENAEKEIAWNFEKFLINRTGRLINRFPSKTEPDDVQLIAAIKAALSK
ncbi:MAG: redoxin domain-containing protein [Bdellovibrionales bacterium]|nr:redoxin domain-containing protein [Bdellovibrionales bacterium]